MKSLILISICLTISSMSYARCVVELFDDKGDPLGFIFQNDECLTAMNLCKAQLRRLSLSGAKCEITLNIPKDKIKNLESQN